MSLLNFLFRDRRREGARRQAGPVAPAPVPASSVPAASPVPPAQQPDASARPAGSAVAPETGPARPAAPVAPAPARPADDRAVAVAPSGADTPDLDEIREALRQIAEIIGEDERPREDYSTGDFTIVEMPLARVAELVPSAFPKGRVPDGQERTLVAVAVKDLYTQLGKGKVVTTVGRMVDQVSEDLLSPDYVRYLREEVSIPLNLVVTSVRPDELMRRTAREEQDVDLDSMPNLFTPPAADPLADPPPAPEPPALHRQQPPAAAAPRPPSGNIAGDESIFRRGPRGGGNGSTPPAPRADPAASRPAIPGRPAHPSRFVFEVDDSAPVFKMAKPPGAAAPASPAAPAVPPPAPVTPAGPVSAPAPAPRPPAGGPEADPFVLRGVDLNRAGADELAARLDGVGHRLARRIVRYREQHGPFRRIAELARVPGFGPATFEKVAGEAWSLPRDNVRRALDYVLGGETDEAPDLRKIADRFADLSGVHGCVFTHQDGYTLAESRKHPGSELLSVLAPQMFKKMLTYVEQLNMGELNPLTLFLGNHAVSIVQSGDLYQSMVHSADKLGKQHVRLLQMVGAELDVRLEKARSVP